MSGVGIAMRELYRQPGRFAPAVATLALLALLAIVFGGLLDGLSRGSTAALRELPVDLIVLDDDARGQIDRSRLAADVRGAVEAIDGVAETGALALARLPVERPDGGIDPVSLLAADDAPATVPSGLGDGAAVDAALTGRGVGVGDRLMLDDVELEVVDTAGIVGLGLSGSAWVELDRWRSIVRSARPDLGPTIPLNIEDFARLRDAWPALTVRVDDGADPALVAGAIDDTVGTTETLTVEQVIAAVPGTEREKRVFTGLIALTVAVAWLVVVLFLALLTIERLPVLSALRAVGLRSRSLIAGLMTQATLVMVAALLVAAALAILVVSLLPPTVPLLLVPGRVAAAVVGLLVAAVVGALGSVHRVLRADPASAVS